ncbi:SGNH/GDSL hydrolase family protein [Mucilaginibacter puniceus]
MNKFRFFIAGTVFLLGGCKLDAVTDLPGPPDFSTFIAIGDSQTAGTANDGLYRDAQLVSFPAIMAKQMNTTFAQPLFSEAEKNGSGYLQLISFNNGIPVITRVTTERAIRGTISVPLKGNVSLYTKYQGSINNYGIPAMKLADINNTNLGNTNGFFERLLSGNAPNNTTTYFNFATAKAHTFFTCWLGGNDVLGYAATGGAGDTLTSKSYFNTTYTQLIGQLTANKQKGVVATIPDVTSLPFFTILTTDSISKLIRAVNPNFSGLYISAKSTADVAATYTTRLATANDLFNMSFDISLIGKPTATASGIMPYGLSPLAPIEHKYVLDQNEVLIVKDHTQAYNAFIKAIAKAKGLAVFDAYTYLNSLKGQAIIKDGVKLSGAYITGGMFSLDGVHLTPRGNAATANEFLKAINEYYRTNLQPVNISGYAAVLP